MGGRRRGASSLADSSAGAADIHRALDREQARRRFETGRCPLGSAGMDDSRKGPKLTDAPKDLALLTNGGPLLLEGSVVERVRRRWPHLLDPVLMNAPMIYSAEGREVLASIYGEYLEAGRANGLPVLLLTPTWRADAGRVAVSRLVGRDLNGDAVRFMAGLRADLGGYASRVLVGGLMGCRGDAYKPEEALSRQEARAHHRPQAEALCRGGVDLLFAATLPEAGEALGLAEAMAATGTPYLVSFIIRPAGTLLDGTPLDEAVARLDGEVDPRPLGYMVNCVHPTTLALALESPAGKRILAAGRFLGLQANTSRKSPEELDGAGELDTEPPAEFAAGMRELRRRFGLRLLGGCCGTDGSHIAALAAALSA
jgi:homocysteine S-methyltransferase